MAGKILIEFMGLPEIGSIAKEWIFGGLSRCSRARPKKMRSTNSTDRLAFLSSDVVSLKDLDSHEICFVETNDIFHDSERVWRKCKILDKDYKGAVSSPTLKSTDTKKKSSS